MSFPVKSWLNVRKLTLAIKAILLILTVFNSVVVWAANECPSSTSISVPVTETFDSYDTCPLDGLQCSNACTIPGNWTNKTNDNIDWTISEIGTPTDRTGPAGGSPDHSSGNYLYLESSCPDIGHSDKQAILLSKRFNFQNIFQQNMAFAELSFDYHMFGEEMGDIHVEASTDNCVNWQEVALISGPQQTSSTETWRTKVVGLADYINANNVRIRLRGVTGKDQFSDLAVDNIVVRQAPQRDIALVDIVEPATGCGLTGLQTVSVLLENLGYEQRTGFPVSYQINGGPIVTETFTGFLDPGSQIVYSFTNRANISTPGQYTISALVALSGDTRPDNDIAIKTLEHVPTISTYPYSENFEGGSGGWIASGTNNTWTYGTPAKTVITGAASGTKAWVTGGLDAAKYRNSEISQLIGPCFNFSTLKFPVIGLKAWWNAEGNYDGAVLQSSINSGQTWQRVGNYGDSANWYNNTAIVGNPGGQTVGWSGSNQDATSSGSEGWVQAGNALSGLASRSSVRLRMAFGSDPVVRDDGFALDDVVVREGLIATKTAAFTLDQNGNGIAEPGDQLQYTITLTSGSFQNITSVIFDDTPDPGTFIPNDPLSPPNPVTTTKGSVTLGNGNGHTAVRVNVGTLTPGASATITMKVVVRQTASGPQICNQGSVTGNGFTGFLTDNPATGGLSDSTCVSGCLDSDGDGSSDCVDGCPNDPNKTQVGQCGCGVVDTDTDGDGTANCIDNCPNDPGKIVAGACGCGIPDDDFDLDGTPNCNDNCPNNAIKTQPGVCGCAVADTDADGDGTPNCIDACPDNALKISPGVCGCAVADTDSDFDGTPDCNDGCPNNAIKIQPGVCGCAVADTDSDADGTPNCNDSCPNDGAKTLPGACGCGVADVDIDNNGTPDCLDACPPGQNGDSDGDSVIDCQDGCPNNAIKTAPGVCGCAVPDNDTDFDGVPNCIDNCPNDSSKTQPGACGCGTPDTDSDNDGTPNCNDSCPSDPLKIAAGICGCGTADTDTDADGTPNCNDSCPSDPLKILPGTCGCGVADADSDSDGAANCVDLCPNDPNKTQPGVCGCGVANTDTDSDGTPDCLDTCPNDPNKITSGVCGCGVADTDSDADGTPNCQDSCPSDPLKSSPGMCGCGVSEVDSDVDGTPNCLDLCSADPNKIVAGACGCGQPETDDDNDGAPNCIDQCPSDPNKTAPNICGCGVSDADSDSDNVVDCQDLCPQDSAKIAAGVCGCGIADSDFDGDGVADCQDSCPADNKKTAPGVCGCGQLDADSDGDGAANCVDQCPNDATKVVTGFCGCGVSDAGAPACVDQCPLDPLKSAPGICGCGAQDSDLNSNGVTDCQLNLDLKKQLSDVSAALRKIKLITAKNRKAQAKFRTALYGQLQATRTYISLHDTQFTVASNSKPLNKLLLSVGKGVSKVAKARDSKALKSGRSLAQKAIKSMVKSIG